MAKKMGRPLKKIDQTQFENLCAFQCTVEEVCEWFEITADTLESWCKRTYDGKTFSKVFAEKRGKGKVSLRRAQYQTALSGNPTMLIWMGKQHLGQTDKTEQKVEVTDPVRITRTFDGGIFVDDGK